MNKRMPKEVLEYLKRMGKAYGKLGGKAAAENMTPEERSARAKKASMAAAQKRTAKRLPSRTDSPVRNRRGHNR
jgi:hypothetical protein